MVGEFHHPVLSEANTAPLNHQSNCDDVNSPDKDKKDTTADAAELPVITRHSITLGGKELDYTVTAGKLPVKNDVGETEAKIFFVAYTPPNPTPGVKRPLLFIFNGGPGSSSVWLHLGAVGPRIVRMLYDGRMPEPPFPLEDNASTWLMWSDLVFIDPDRKSTR